YHICVHPTTDWPGTTPETQCAYEHHEKANCRCPPGSIETPNHDYSRNVSDKERKHLKCSAVDTELPVYTCIHVPGYSLSEDLMCELRVRPDDIIAAREIRRYDKKFYKLNRNEMRTSIRYWLSNKKKQKFTKV